MKNKVFLLMLGLVIGILAACGTAENETSTNGSGSAPDSSTDATTEETKVLTVGTSADYAPFEFVDTKVSEDIIGFDIDLANLIAERLGYELKFTNSDFNSLIPGLQAKKYDLVISGMTPTEERDEVVDFSTPYYETEQYMVSMKESNITSMEDLKGKKVGAQVSSIQEDLAKEFGEEHGFTVESRDLIPQLIQEMKNGRLDAAVIENIVSDNYLSQNDDLAAFTIKVEEPDYKAVVFQEGSTLKAEFDGVIQELIDGGKIEELKKKWFVVE
ncbi:transporter substrate-binding domain-containing protein [Ureibacillus chungkukjangi]|uniref:transporter substrate-binding domain-containing protein n=1 Tax=Ureibacillus chungkukjangi TaxID=1202712 RepID=UPI00203FD594|nr:transporter substrate-binding domain-containing protein [Ureibacillus chungkukjangi]MCM3390171.1 transporter substrate-binding domain-containing protein [Ureibacillus chungkukjangi]